MGRLVESLVVRPVHQTCTQVAVRTTDAYTAEVLDGARQLELEVERLWLLDSSILR